MLRPKLSLDTLLYSLDRRATILTVRVSVKFQRKSLIRAMHLHRLGPAIRLFNRKALATTHTLQVGKMLHWHDKLKARRLQHHTIHMHLPRCPLVNLSTNRRL